MIILAAGAGVAAVIIAGLDPVSFLIVAALVAAYVAMHNIAGRGRARSNAWQSRYNRRRSH